MRNATQIKIIPGGTTTLFRNKFKHVTEKKIQIFYWKESV